MSINVWHNQLQANKLENYISSLREMKYDLINFKANLNEGWQAKEMVYINNTIDDLTKEINKLSSELDAISSDIVAVVHEIKKEEDEKEAAEKAKADAEAKAKAKAAAQ